MKDIRTEKLEEGMIIPIIFDYHFVRIFGQKDNMDILEYFISDFYNIPIKDINGNIELLSRDLKQDDKVEKSKQVDLLLNLDDKKINIEKLIRWCRILKAKTRDEMERRTELKEAIEKTTKKVKKQSKIDMAKKMIDEKIETEVISKITGLSKEEINTL